MQHAAAQSWLDLQCKLIPGVSHGLLSLGTQSGGDDELTARWPSGGDAPDYVGVAAREAAARGAPVIRSEGVDGDATVVACPLRRGNRMLGSVAVSVHRLPGDQQGSVAQILGWGSAWLDLLLEARGEGSGHAEAVLPVCRAAIAAKDAASAASAAANRIARLLGCERASIALGEAHRLELVAVSDAAAIDPRSRLARDLQVSIAAGLEAQRPSEASQAPVHLTLALNGRGAVIGALYLERPAEHPFEAGDVALAAAMADNLGPVLDMLQHAERGLTARLAEGLSVLAHGSRAALLGLLLAAVTWLCFASGEYRVSAPALIEGGLQRALVAPIDGYVREARVRAGDVIDAGTLVATLDDEPLQFERRRWLGEHAELERQQQHAIAKLERARASVLEAQMGKAAAQIALIDEQLARTRIRAPFDGVVVSGDLSQSLGAPVKRGDVLFEMAPLDSYRVVLRVPETEVGAITAGQRGEVALAGLSDGALPLVVERVSGAADSDGGVNAFRVEARLQSDSVHLLPGLRGVAKISIDERRLIWIWTHALVEKTRLWLWRWLP